MDESAEVEDNLQEFLEVELAVAVGITLPEDLADEVLEGLDLFHAFGFAGLVVVAVAIQRVEQVLLGDLVVVVLVQEVEDFHGVLDKCVVLLAAPTSFADLHGHHKNELLEINRAALVLIHYLDQTVDFRVAQVMA